MTAQRNIPAQAADNYKAACLSLKAGYTSDYDKNVKAEKSRNWTSQQNIMDKYSRQGMSFSKSQKQAQQKETSLHESTLDQLKKQYDKQLASLGC
jgi:hypothetical protein